MKILILSATFPYPPTGGGTEVRTFNLLKALSERHQITLVTQRTDDISETDVEKLQEWVKELGFPSTQQLREQQWTAVKNAALEYIPATRNASKCLKILLPGDAGVG